MLTALRQFLLNWLKAQFKGNPLVEQPGEYLSKVVIAFQTWIITVIVLIAFAAIGSVVFIVGALKQWF